LGNDLWKRFFALTASAIALLEKRPGVPGCPTIREELSQELKSLYQQLRVPDLFYGLSTGVRATTERTGKDVVAYILELDSNLRQTKFTGFASNEEAAEEYMRLEKENLGKPHIQTVLVSVDSLAALKKAYPSYYLDTDRFTKLVNRLIVN